MAFEIEYATYRRHLPELLPFTGHFALVHGTEIAGVYPTYEEVIEAAYARFHTGEFMIIQINTVEPPPPIMTVYITNPPRDAA